MKTAPSGLLDLIANPKQVHTRATFRITRPQFAVSGISDSLGITDPTQIDACVYGTGILRVTNHGNVLYTQYISDVNAAWPAWSSAGITLLANSRPAVDDGYVWYIKSTEDVCWRDYRSWSTEHKPGLGIGQIATLAPIGNQHCYLSYYQAMYGTTRIMYVKGTGATNMNENPSYIYGVSLNPPPFDAVQAVDPVTGQVTDYLYAVDLTAGRIVEIPVRPDDTDNWSTMFGQRHSIVAIDAIDAVYGLKLYKASLVNGKVIVTGRLTRTSDGSPVSMDVYLTGPDIFQFGRDMYISSGVIGGPMLLVGSQLVIPGATNVAKADATNLYGVDNASMKLATSDIENLRLVEGENRSSFLEMSLSPALSHAALSKGSEVTLEIAYNSYWMTVFTGEIDEIRRVNEDGQQLQVSIISKTTKRIGQWSPDQGVYIPSQAFTLARAQNLAQIVRADGNFAVQTDGSLKPTDINKMEVLYTASRASRGGIVRAKFKHTGVARSVTNNPTFGVGLNYYRETTAEAAKRLKLATSKVTNSMLGHNGVVVLYSETNCAGGPGFRWYAWKNSKLTDISGYGYEVTLPANTWIWLQLSFIEGLLTLSYRTANTTSWTVLFCSQYLDAAPWANEQTGHGCVLLKRSTTTRANIPLYVDNIEFYSEEEDITLDEALHQIVRLAGGECSSKKAVDAAVVASTVNNYTLQAVPLNGSTNFISEIFLPGVLSLTSGVQLGMIFYAGSTINSSAWVPAYKLSLEVGTRQSMDTYTWKLWKVAAGAFVLITAYEWQAGDDMYGSRPHGRIKFSVQDGRMGIWMNGRLEFVFYDKQISNGPYRSFFIYNPNHLTLPAITFRSSELDDLVADINVGTRGQGMSALSELLSDRPVYFRQQPDGSMYFYKNPTDGGALPDIVTAISRDSVDNQVSRVRAEGVNIAEVANFPLMRTIGNLFETINSQYAGTVEAIGADANREITRLKQRSEMMKLTAVLHPALQPGDEYDLLIADEDPVNPRTIDVVGTELTLGFSGENFDAEMVIDAYKP